MWSEAVENPAGAGYAVPGTLTPHQHSPDTVPLARLLDGLFLVKHFPSTCIDSTGTAISSRPSSLVSRISIG